MARSRTRQAVRPLERARDRVEARLAAVVARTDAFGDWIAAVEALMRRLLGLELALGTAYRHNRRVAAKFAMLRDARARQACVAALGGEAALAAWEERAREAERQDAGAVLELASVSGLAGLEPIRALGGVGKAAGEYGEPSWRLPALPQERGTKRGTRRGARRGAARAKRRDEVGERAVRNWLAGIEVWPEELRRAAAGEAGRAWSPGHWEVDTREVEPGRENRAVELCGIGDAKPP